VDTFELLPSLAQGSLPESSIPELVAAAVRSRASGTLWLETPQAAEVRVFFRAGDMCGASSFPGVQTLAHVLLANDWVNALDIESTQEESVRTKRRHGEVLVARRLLTPEQLQAALVAQHTTNLLNLMRITAGQYDWRGWEPPPAWAREVVVHPVGCLVDAMEEEQHAPRRAKVMAWLGDHPVQLSVDWPDLQERATLAAVDRRAAALLALPRTLPDFVRISQLPQSRAEALLATLLLVGAAEARDLADAVIEAEPLPEPPPEPAPPPPRKRHQNGAPLDEREQLARLDSLSLEDLENDASSDEVELELDHERAGRRTPAAGSAPQRGVSSGGMDEERARELRKKMLARGMRNLSGAPRSGIEGGVESPAESQAAAVQGHLSSDDQRFTDEVRSRLRLAPSQNAYLRLGLDSSANSESIRASYLNLAKRFHPDRAAGPALSFLQAELQTLFSLLKEAYEHTSSPDGRERYDASLKAASPAEMRREEAAIALKMGDALLKKRDFAAAVDKLRLAVDLDESGDSLAALAWCLVSDPKSPAPAREEAASLINRALRAPGATARTFYVAGVLWRTKDPDSAADAFRQALEIDPKHPDAALELRLIEQRRGKQAKAPGVLSGLLFGKRKS
jgi:curved DNA-binding protein CbpA